MRLHWLTGGLGSGLSWESRPSLSNSPSSSRRLDWVFLHGDRVPRASFPRVRQWMLPVSYGSGPEAGTASSDPFSGKQTARRSNQSILKEISSDCPLEGLMLKLQYFGHLMRRADSLEKTLMLGKIEGRRRRGQQMMKLLDSITNLMDTSLSKLQEIVEHRGAWHATACGSQRAEQNLAIEQQMYDHPCQLGQ